MKKGALKILAVSLSLLCLLLASCATTSNAAQAAEGQESQGTQEEAAPQKKKKPAKKRVGRVKFDNEAYDQAVKAQDFDKAYGMIETLGSKANIAKMLDQSLILFRGGFYEEADKKFDQTTKALDDAFAKSIIQGAATTILNENLKEYSGTLYEFLLVDTFAALNAYKMGDVELAHILLTRVYEKQKKYVADYGELVLRDEDDSSKKDGSAGPKEMEAGLGMIGVTFHVPYDIPPKLTRDQKDSLIYKTSALADYLQIVIAAQNGSFIDDFTVRELKSLAPQVETDSAELPYAKGRIEVLALTGTIAQRKEHVDWLAIDLLDIGRTISAYAGYENALRFKYVWPECLPQKDVVKASRVTIQGQGQNLSKQVVLLEDFDKAAINDVRLKAHKAAWRSVWRSTSKKAVGLAGIIATVKNDPTEGFLTILAIVAGAQGLRAIDMSERADVRQSQALFSKAYTAGFTVDPGIYTVTVEYSDGTKEVVENVKVVSGRPVLVESICQK